MPQYEIQGISILPCSRIKLDWFASGFAGLDVFFSLYAGSVHDLPARNCHFQWQQVHGVVCSQSPWQCGKRWLLLLLLFMSLVRTYSNTLVHMCSSFCILIRHIPYLFQLLSILLTTGWFCVLWFDECCMCAQWTTLCLFILTPV